MGRKKLNIEEFIKRSEKIHKNKYDYSKVEYITDRIKVKIICPEHGEFEQRPNHHSRGIGCPKCVGMNKTTEKIINEFKEIHGNKYDYNLVLYVNSKSKVKIICPEHGVFEQSSSTHLKGHGCPICFSEKLSKLFSYSTEKFIEICNKIHKNKYNYSLVQYKNSNSKIKIICPEHGEFEQLASSHISGKGCQKCGFNKVWKDRKITTEDFIKKAIKIHGNKYDYSLVEYKNAISKVKIICPEHGFFEQTPNSHLSKSGCMKCGGRYSEQNDFLEKTKKIHGDIYDYNLVNYKNAKTKIKIICKKHGVFEQLPNSHLSGSGCPKCGKINSIKNQTILQTDFIDKCNLIHNHKYNYNLVDYKNCKIKVKIICPEHGIFDQLPDHHSRGVGCPECSNKYGGKFSERDLYIFYDEKYNLMKIGISKEPEKRIKGISKGQNKEGLILLKSYKKSALLENLLHKKYAEYRTKHILYKEGFTEWFKLDKSEIKNIDKFIRFCKLDNLDYKKEVSF